MLCYAVQRKYLISFSLAIFDYTCDLSSYAILGTGVYFYRSMIKRLKTVVLFVNMCYNKLKEDMRGADYDHRRWKKVL